MYEGYYVLVDKEDWYFNPASYPESCRKDDCVYEKDGLQYCFTPMDPELSPTITQCVY